MTRAPLTSAAGLAQSLPSPRAAAPAGAPLVAVDAHAHLHACFHVDRFLDRAGAALRGALRTRSSDGDPPPRPSGSDAPRRYGALVLMEAAGGPTFSQMLDRVRRESAQWGIVETGEPISAICRRVTGEELVLIRGQQVTSRERLEVLTIGIEESLPHGDPFEQSLGRALASGATTVLPWGFGKWVGVRGRLVERALRGKGRGFLFVGDNGGRLAGSRPPRLLLQAMERGVWNLPGSDPLPFPSETGQVGAMGFLLDCDPEREMPARELTRRLQDMREQPATFGEGQRLLPFAGLQVRMQLKGIANRMLSAE